MASPVAILPSAPPLASPSWAEQLQDALSFELGQLKNITTLISLGEGGGLALRREQTERRIDDLVSQLSEARREVSRG